MKMKIKKIWENEFKFWSLHIKISLYDNFYENLKKNWQFLKTFLTNRGKSKAKDDTIWKNEFDIWILQIKIRLHGNFHKNLRKKKSTHF